MNDLEIKLRSIPIGEEKFEELLKILSNQNIENFDIITNDNNIYIIPINNDVKPLKVVFEN